MRRILLRLESREVLEQQMQLYRLDYNDQLLCAAVITDRELVPGNENRFFTDKVEELLDGRELYTEKILMDHCVVIIQPGIDFRTWAARLEERNERVRKRFGKGLEIAVGHNVSNWYDLTHSYEFARFLMEHRFLFDGFRVLTMDAIQEQEQLAENPSVDYFCMLIEVGDIEGLEKSVRKFQQYCMKRMMKELDIKIQVMYNLMQIRNWAAQKYDGAKELELSRLMTQINEVEKLEELMKCYCRALQQLCISIGREGSETVIKRMYYYMEKNYEKDLKVETFAKMFHYNSSYLGKIFRKEMGDSFNNILDTIRIKNAKRLLTETDLKVYQISESVGYTNTDYFYLKFKKYVGMSPKEYKKESGVPV